MRRAITVLFTLLACAGLITGPAVGSDVVESSAVLASPLIIELGLAPFWMLPGAGAVSSCVEPSPCQTHADCDYPHGRCLPNWDYPEVPSPKVCLCLPDQY